MSAGFIVGMILLALLGGYVFTSLLLLKFPYLVHQKKKLKFTCRHISHRGGAGECLENTMAAFQHAVAMGTEMLEIDCHITRDGHVVISHDNNLQRVTGQRVLISDTDFKDLPLLMPQLRLDFMQSHVTQGGTDRQIAPLRELFENFPNIPINIDIKINNNQLIRKVSELVREYKRETLTIWGNRSREVTDKCFAENPDILLLFSMRRVLVLLALFYTGILPFVSIKESAFEIPMPSIMLKKALALQRATGEMQLGFAFRFLIRLADFLLLNKSLFAHLRRRGIHTYLWVLNDVEDFDRAFRYGATGVMTDFPTKLSQFLEKKDRQEDERNAVHVPMSKLKKSSETDQLVELPAEKNSEIETKM